MPEEGRDSNPLIVYFSEYTFFFKHNIWILSPMTSADKSQVCVCTNHPYIIVSAGILKSLYGTFHVFCKLYRIITVLGKLFAFASLKHLGKCDNDHRDSG